MGTKGVYFHPFLMILCAIYIVFREDSRSGIRIACFQQKKAKYSETCPDPPGTFPDPPGPRIPGSPGPRVTGSPPPPPPPTPAEPPRHALPEHCIAFTAFIAFIVFNAFTAFIVFVLTRRIGGFKDKLKTSCTGER